MYHPEHTDLERRSILPWLFVLVPGLIVGSTMLSLAALA